MKIDRASAVPLYYQVARVLRHQIETGKFKPGSALPPENELSNEYRVSRITTRKALDIIASEGLIVRKQGKGTYVCPPKIQQDLAFLQGFAELMATHGSEQAMEVIAFNVVAADHAVARSLHLGVGDPVLGIKRRHTLKGSPIAFALIYLPVALGQLITLEEASATPIYSLLAEKAHVEIKRATQVIRARVADQVLSNLLEIPRGAPVMQVERVTFSADEIPVEYIVFSYRGDSYELAVELHRDPTRNILRPVDHLARLLMPV